MIESKNPEGLDYEYPPKVTPPKRNFHTEDTPEVQINRWSEPQKLTIEITHENVIIDNQQNTYSTDGNGLAKAPEEPKNPEAEIIMELEPRIKEGGRLAYNTRGERLSNFPFLNGLKVFADYFARKFL
jgi:hypothetical protein